MQWKLSTEKFSSDERYERYGKYCTGFAIKKGNSPKVSLASAALYRQEAGR